MLVAAAAGTMAPFPFVLRQDAIDRETSSIATTMRATTREPVRMHAKDAMQRKLSDENQVMPFRLDDGEDDLEEIRRRRYSSCYSSSSSEVDDYRSRTRRGKPQSNSSRDRENDWDRASRGAPSSSSCSDDHGDDGDDVDGAHAFAKRPSIKITSRSDKAQEEPESPRKHHRRTQQSDESAGDDSHGVDNDDDETSSDDGKAVAASASPVRSSPAAQTAPLSPKLALAPTMPVDLSRISKLAIFPGSETNLLQGHIVRVKTLLHPQYQLFIKDQLILMAGKQPKNRTSNYHIFDMTRTTALSAKLTKKSGNYIGKLRSNFSKRKSVLIGNLSRKTELGAIRFANSTSTSEPRHLNVILPALSAKRQEIEGLTVGDTTTSFSLLLDMFASTSEPNRGAAAAPVALPTPLQVFENKEPVFENGYYRLNFNGRVSVPSVKNFQLVRAGIQATDADVCLQFGKVDDKKFHLDFRAPLTPIQAFAIAIAQFNL